MAQPVIDCPEEDEFEVNLFGPGYGECVVVHLGGGHWLINDSCLDSSKTQPIALSYLNRIGVDFSKQVKMVVASHWHDDHVRGLAKVVDACESAIFSCSQALRSSEFFQLVQASQDESSSLGSGLREFRSIMHLLDERKKRLKKDVIAWACADRTLWRHPDLKAVSIHALAPSDDSITRSMHEIGQLVEEVRFTGNRVPHIEPNHTSVVLWVDLGFERILLSGDLEHVSSSPLTGWIRICDSTTRPNGQAGIYKVAHHGSATGHYPQKYGNLVCQSPISILTPFNRGNVNLPTIADRRRINTLSSLAYITVDKPQKRKIPRGPAVERILRESKTRLQIADPTVGHIRLRRRRDASEWTIRADYPAGQLTQ